MQQISITGQLPAAASHIESVARMIEQDTYSINIIRKIQVIQATLKNIASQLLENYFNDYVMIGIESADLIEPEKILKEITAHHLRRDRIRVKSGTKPLPHITLQGYRHKGVVKSRTSQ